MATLLKLHLGFSLFYSANSMNTRFFHNTRLKLAKNQAKAKQDPEAKLLVFENYSFSSSTVSSKNKRKYSRKYGTNQVCQMSLGDYMINYNEDENEKEK